MEEYTLERIIFESDGERGRREERSVTFDEEHQQLLQNLSEEITRLKDRVSTSTNTLQKKKTGRLSSDVYSMLLYIPLDGNEGFKRGVFAYTLVVFLLQMSIQTFILIDLLDYPDDRVWPNPPKDITSVVRISQFFACILALLFQDDVSASLMDMQTGCQVIFKETIANRNDGELKPREKELFWVSCIAKFLTGAQSLFLSLVVILQSENLIDLFQNFAAMAFVSMIDNIGFTVVALGFLHRYLEEVAKKVSSYRYDDSFQNERKRWINRPTTLVNLCMLLPLLGTCGYIDRIQTSGDLFCQTLTLSVPGDTNVYNGMKHWGVYVFKGDRIHARPLYVEESCDFNTHLMYPNLCGFLAYCGRTQRWSFVIGTEGAKDDFRDNCHRQDWVPKQSEPPNPIIQTHYMISGETTSFSVFDASDWHEVGTKSTGTDVGLIRAVESFELSCKDCKSDQDCNGRHCDASTTRRCNCGMLSFGMMCQESVYPCEQISFDHGVNLGNFFYVTSDNKEKGIINFVNRSYNLMRSHDGSVVTFNERPVYYNYQRYHRASFREVLINEASSSLENFKHLEPLVTRNAQRLDEVLVISYFSGKQWNFVSPLSLTGVAQRVMQQNEELLLENNNLLSSKSTIQESIRHMFHFHSKQVQMGFQLEQLHEWNIISTGHSPLPTDVPSGKRYQILSDFTPTWYQLENLSPTLAGSISNDIDSSYYLSCSDCNHEYSDTCRYPENFCHKTSGSCVNLAVRYPNCSTYDPSLIMNGQCNNVNGTNTEECGFDGGDCISFNVKYPNCNVTKPYFVGSGSCSSPEYNIKECDMDGGDCEWYNANFTTQYPDCNVVKPWLIRNGRCSVDPEYNSKECGYDGGDCLHPQYPNCMGINPEKIGNGKCDTSLDEKKCGWDGGDCIVHPKYPACRVDDARVFVGNGVCNSPFNSEECAWDGGDCDEFNQNMKELRERYPGAV